MAHIQTGDYRKVFSQVAEKSTDLSGVGNALMGTFNAATAVAHKANESKLANYQIDLANKALKINNDINIKYQDDPTNPEREKEFNEQFELLASEYKVNPLVQGKWGQIKTHVMNNYKQYNARWEIQQQQTNASNDLRLGYENSVNQMFMLGQNGASIDEVRMIYANNENALATPARGKLGDVVVDTAMSKFKHDSMANYIDGVIQTNPALALELLNDESQGVLNDLNDPDTIKKLKQSAQTRLLRKAQIDAVDRVAGYINQNTELFEKAFNGTITTQEAQELLTGDLDKNMKAILSDMLGYSFDESVGNSVYSEYVLDDKKWSFVDENGKVRKITNNEKEEITAELYLKGSRILNGIDNISSEDAIRQISLFQSQVAQAKYFGINDGDYNKLMQEFVLPATKNIQAEAQQYSGKKEWYSRNTFGYKQIEDYFEKEFKESEQTSSDLKEINKEESLASVYYWAGLKNECSQRGISLSDLNNLSGEEKVSIFNKAAKNAINQAKATSSNPQLWFRAANPQYVSAIRGSLPSQYADDVITNVAVAAANNPTMQQKDFEDLIDKQVRNSYAKLRTSNKAAVFGGNTKYDNLINGYAMQYNIDPLLIKAIIKQESGFNPNAKSGAGAKGLMQLMPATAREVGVKNPLDPKQNIAGGVKYFAKQLEAFDGNIPLALAAYNAGAGNVKKYGNKIPPFKETQNYVKNIMATYNSIKG